MPKNKYTDSLKTNGTLWAEKWLHSRNVINIKTNSSLIFGTSNDGRIYGVWVLTRLHNKKSIEPVTISNLDYNTPERYFEKNRIEKAYTLVARGYEPFADSGLSLDHSKYLLIPRELMVKYLRKRSPKKEGGRVTMDIGFDSKQNSRWTTEGVKYYPMFNQKEQQETQKNFSAPLDINTSSVWTGKFEGQYFETYRKEQDAIRKKLFGNNVYSKCCICGNQYPVDLMWASHIKKRSECTDSEMGDIDNICAPMCKLGCDELFEKGYIVIKDGWVKINGNKRQGLADLSKVLIKLENKRCLVWGNYNRTYFEWHYNKHMTESISFKTL